MRRTRFSLLPNAAPVRASLRAAAEPWLQAGWVLASLFVLLALLRPGGVLARGTAEDAQAETCRLGTYAYGEFDRAAALQPLADWLQSQTGCAWQAEVLDSPGSLADAMASGELDWGVPNLVGHLRALQRAPSLHAGLPIAVPPADAARYRSLLLARAGTVAGLDALKADAHRLRLGLTFADSASGGLVPAARLAAAGLDARSDFADLRYTGRHDASLRLLLAGELDLIGLPADLLPATQRADVQLLAESSPIPVRAMLCGGRSALRFVDGRARGGARGRGECARTCAGLARVRRSGRLRKCA